MTDRVSSSLLAPNAWTFDTVCLLILCFTGASTAAQDFAAQTTVTSPQEPALFQQYVTVFTEHRIYDIATEPLGVVTIWDSARKQVVILDTARRKQTVISHDDLLKMSAGIQVRAAKGPPLVQTAAKPDFQIQWDRSRTHLTLSTTPLTYQSELMAAKTEQHSRRYRDFADWSARLNSLRGLPAAARLCLNREIFTHQRLPKQIERRLNWGHGKTELAQSQHEYRWSLSDADREWVAKSQEWEVDLPRVALHQFQVVDAKPPAATSDSQR